MREPADREVRSNSSTSAKTEWELRNSLASFSSLSLDLATRITFCLRAASACAKTLPSPWEAPVTRAKLEFLISAHSAGLPQPLWRWKLPQSRLPGGRSGDAVSRATAARLKDYSACTLSQVPRWSPSSSSAQQTPPNPIACLTLRYPDVKKRYKF